VALLVPPPVACEVDAIRRALDDPALERVPPHVTLVPPTNVAIDELPDVLAVLRAAAAHTGHLDLELGPPRAFDTDAGVIYLAVGGPDLDSGALVDLHVGCRSGPLDRPLDHEFVPHVTLTTGVAAAGVSSILDAIDGFGVRTVTIDHLHLLQQQPAPPHRWDPVAEVPLTPSNR
jgi:2'-5' RNA ligase